MLLATKLSKENAGKIFEGYMDHFDENVRPQLKHAFDLRYRTEECGTLGELRELLVNVTQLVVVDWKETREKIIALNWVVDDLSEEENSVFEDKIPPYYPLGDTNWRGGITVGYGGSALGPEDVMLEKEEVLHESTWTPGPTTEWTFLDFVPSTNGFTRNYCVN